MSKTLRQTRIRGWFECYREECPICGHMGGCIIHEDGEKVACIRQESKIPFSKNSACPSWLHFLKNGKEVDVTDVNDVPQEKKKSPQTLNIVYRAMLKQTSLEKEHLDHLTSDKRGLNIQQVITRQYRSKPQKAWQTVKHMTKTYGMNNFKGIPGFYLHEKNQRSFWNIHGAEGIFIPFRNEKNQITGFQIRVDHPKNEVVVQPSNTKLKARIKKHPNLVQVINEDGAIVLEEPFEVGEKRKVGQAVVTLKKGQRYFWLSSANKPYGTSPGNPIPLHVAVPSPELNEWKTGNFLQKKSVWLSEGPLKCDIASDLITECYTNEELKDIGDTFIALPGVGSWRLALDVIQNIGANRVNIAFDADSMKNPYVQRHLKDAVQGFREKGIELYIAIWNPNDGNGIDDCLLNRKRPQLKKL